MNHIPHRVALVTDASRGIGRAVATAMSAEGFDVAVGFATQADEPESVIHAIEAHGRGGIAVAGDLADLEACTDLVKETTRRFSGRLGP